MLKDITIGQYYVADSVIHRLDPRTKILLVLGYIVMLFFAKDLVGMIPAFLLLAAAYLLAKIPGRMILKSIKPILPILVLTGVLNLFFVKTGQLLVDVWFIKIYEDGIRHALLLMVRILLLIVSSSLLTYTTSPISLTDGIERLLSPLKAVRFPAHELAMMMTLALRFIPTLIEETEKIMNAQKARGADLESGGLLTRVRSLIPIFIPLFVSAFRRAEELALAMDCRCYQGDTGRTRMKQLHFGLSDLLAALVVVLCMVLVMMMPRII